MRIHHILIGFLATLSLNSTVNAAESTAAAPNLSVIGAIPGPDGGWDYASIDSNAHRLYVAHGDAVLTVDLDSGKVNPTLIDGNRLHAVVPLPDGKALSTNGGANTATLFETATGKMIAAIPTGDKPDAAIYDPPSGLVLVMNGQSGDITLIDPKTAASPGKIAIGGALEFATADGRGRAYVNIEDKGEIAVVDIAGRKVVTHYKLPGCEEPSGLAINPETGVLVAACSNKVAMAVQSKTGAVLAKLAIGEHPDAVIFDPNRKLFFIPCGGDGNLAIVAEGVSGVPAVVGTVSTAVGARTGALDVRTGRLYLPTADFKALEAGEKRRAPLPGTFRILIVGEK